MGLEMCSRSNYWEVSFYTQYSKTVKELMSIIPYND